MATDDTTNAAPTAVTGFCIQCGDATAANASRPPPFFAMAEVAFLKTAEVPQPQPPGIVVTASASDPANPPSNLIDGDPATLWSSGDTIYWPGPTVPLKQTTWVQFDFRKCPGGSLGFYPASFRVEAANDGRYINAPISLAAWISTDPNLADTSWTKVGFYGDPSKPPGNLTWLPPTTGADGKPVGNVGEFAVTQPIPITPTGPTHTSVKAEIDAAVANLDKAVDAAKAALSKAVAALEGDLSKLTP